MLQALVIIAAALVALLMLLLLWPVRVRVFAAPQSAWVEVRYFLWYMRRDVLTGRRTLRFGGINIPEVKARPPRPKRAAAPPEKPEPEIPARDRVRTAWQHRPVIRRTVLVLARLIGRLLRSVHLDTGRARLAFGLETPGETGMLAGFLFATRPALLALLPKWSIGLEPDFTAARFAAEIDMSLRLIPLEPFAHIVKALGTLPWRGLWKLKAAWNAPYREEECPTT